MQPVRSSRRRGLLAALAIAAVALVASACVPDAPTPPPTTLPGGTVKTVNNAVFEWTVSREADNGSFAPGQVNYWSAGESDGTAATYVPTNDNATVLKKNASGNFVPIGSEAAVSYANRNRDGAGNIVTASNAFYLGQKIRYTGGTGTVDIATGASTIQWTGTVTINFYGQYVPFWFVNPKLTVAADGSATLTATLGGYASDISTPDVRTALAPAPNVVLANFSSVHSGGSIATGFTKVPNYLDTAVTTPAAAPQVAKTGANTAYWGAWPQSFVDFQAATGLGQYWYTSGGAADVHKPQEAVAISYTLTP